MRTSAADFRSCCAKATPHYAMPTARRRNTRLYGRSSASTGCTRSGCAASVSRSSPGSRPIEASPWPTGSATRSECTYYCPDAATAERCIQSLRDSDERLRSRPEEQMLWDWQSTYWEAEIGNENGGGTVLLGVAWYDQQFFDDRRGAWFGTMHRRIYQQLGIPMEDITVTHWTLLK